MPPPNNSSDVRIEPNAEMLSEDRPKDNTASSTRAKILFMALRSVIIPIVQAAVPNCPDLHELPLEFEAENFLAMLQKFMSCIIRDESQSDNQNGITQTADVEDLRKQESPSIQTNEEIDKINSSTEESKKTHSGAVLFQEERPKKSESIVPRSPIPPVDPREEAQFNKALSQLRAYVFNDMPMRLLCFKKRGSKLDITLLDRAGIFSHLVPKLKTTFESRYSPFSSLRSNIVADTALYAILSHTWLRSAFGEVTYDDWHNLKGALDLTHPGYQKLINFCNVASEKHGLTLGWMDTVCINKASSAELDESIRSMYKWYEKATVCITYLAETTTLSEMAKDPWFTRGWTLQELLAPRSIIFYDNNWGAIGHYFRSTSFSITAAPSEGLREQIKLATTITPQELEDPRLVSISRKMQWAANRDVTREEDAAYSLMGIFNVNMSIAYGEGGQAAFFCLIKEILSSAQLDAMDVFNWGWGSFLPSDKRPTSVVSSLLPSSAKGYLLRSTLRLWKRTLVDPLTLTHLGLRIPVLLLQASPTSILSVRGRFTPIGNYYATVTLTPWIPNTLSVHSYNALDAENAPIFKEGVVESSGPNRIAFGILNCGGDEAHIDIPNNCFGIAILYMSDIANITATFCHRVETKEPIVFSLKHTRSPQKLTHSIERTELAHHGMRLLTMYL